MSLLTALIEEDLLSSSLQSPPKEVWLAVRTDRPMGLGDSDAFGAGTFEDPYDAGTAGRFDNLMRVIGSDTTIYLGPGIFRTAGAGIPLGLGFFVRPGQ